MAVVVPQPRADDVWLVLFHGLQIIFDWIVDAKVDDFKASTFHHHAHQVLANVVNVALHGADHHFAKARRSRCDQQGRKPGARPHAFSAEQPVPGCGMASCRYWRRHRADAVVDLAFGKR